MLRVSMQKTTPLNLHIFRKLLSVNVRVMVHDNYG